MLNHSQQEQLKSVEVTDQEASEILLRLSIQNHQSFRERSTIRDISELTEVPMNSIARILAEIRGEDELALVAQEVGQHEQRISKIEEATSSTDSLVFGRTSATAMTKADRTLATVLITLALLLTLFFAFQLTSQNIRSPKVVPLPVPVETPERFPGN